MKNNSLEFADHEIWGGAYIYINTSLRRSILSRKISNFQNCWSRVWSLFSLPKLLQKL
jgi:hypothetical protein